MHLKKKSQVPTIQKFSENRIKQYALKTKGLVPVWSNQSRSPCYAAIVQNIDADASRLFHSRLVKSYFNYLLDKSNGNKKTLSEVDILSWSPNLEPIVHGHLEHMIEAFWLLHKHQHQLTQDKLSDNFGVIGTLPRHSFAKSLALRKTERTKNIPMHLGMFILDRAVRWVVDYSDDLLDQRDELNRAAGEYTPPRMTKKGKRNIINKFSSWIPSSAPGSPWPVYPAIRIRNGGNENSFHEKGFTSSLGYCLERLLPSACFIVIAVFTARRLNEILRLRHGCLRNKPQGRCIEFYIEKTIRDWDDDIPCPEIVEKAIRILERLSESARFTTGDNRLFQQIRVNTESDAVMYFNPRSLRDFIRFIDVPSDLVDKTKFDPEAEIAPHQFRRFFSILFVWQYKYGTLSALKQQLRHTSIEMTKVYVSQLHRGDIFGELNKEVNYKLLSQVAFGTDNFTGNFAEKFKEDTATLLADYRKTLSVVHKKQAIKRLKQHIDESGIRVIPLPWGLCSADSDSVASLKKARCLEGDPKKAMPEIGINLDAAAPSICKACPNCSYSKLFDIEE